MNRIRLLPEQVANQIAAGEVIERPASVVKELVENSLDAQATRVTVEIQAGGRSLVRVTDDGLGMSRDDALLCLERHATSKIRRAEDLAAIATMGFRGEALPSIASVSRFTLTTRERDSGSPEGTQVIINGGKIVEVKAAGSAPGTTVEVRQLFFNLPARRKFLRTEETESAHIQHYLTLAALAYPEVAFTFQRDGRLVWQLPAVKTGGDTPARLTALAGTPARALRRRAEAAGGGLLRSSSNLPRNRTPKPLPPQPSTLDPQPSSASGVSSARPAFPAPPREDQHLFVNRRPVENRGLNFALLEGYHTALMKGRYPVCCLFLEIDPAAVDVNIHPAKREVKFHREAEVRRLVAQAVRQTLLDIPHGQARCHEPETCGAVRRSTVVQAGAGQRADRRSSRVAELPGRAACPHRCSRRSRAAQQPPACAWVSAPPRALAAATAGPQSPIPARRLPPSSRPSPPRALRLTAASEPVPLLNVPLRLVGVIGKLYVVLESDRGLVLLDQHAAHERILFEQMLTRLERHDQAPSQRLLLPETVELSARDATFLREQLPALTRLGVGLERIWRAHVPARCPAALCEGARRPAVCAGAGGRTEGRRAGGERPAAGRAYRGQDRLPPCREGQRPAGGQGTGEPGRGPAPLRDALHLPARPADAHRNELPRAGEEVRADAVTRRRNCASTARVRSNHQAVHPNLLMQGA